VLLEAVTGAEGVLDRPSPEVWVEEFADSGVGVAVRFWHAPDIATLWRVRSEVAVATRRALERDGIEIPFPQRVVRLRRWRVRARNRRRCQKALYDRESWTRRSPPR
jgi:small conductance mechanosensitive channel